MKKLALFLVLTLLISSFTVFADDSSEQTYTNEEVLKEVLYAYHRKGTKIHYDTQYKIARRQISASPEDITSQRKGYLDCSGYANAAYMEAFGVNIYPAAADQTRPSTGNFRTYAKNYAGTKADAIGYWDINQSATDEEKAALKAEILSDIKFGDVIVVRYPGKTAETGHVLVHMGQNENGEDILIHCYGGTSYVLPSNPANAYDDAEWEDDPKTPAIDIFKLLDFFVDGSRYYFYNSDKPIYSFSILRPLARNLTPTAEALKRMEIKGLTMEKTSQPHEHAAVNTGDEITYTFTLENKGSENLSNVPLTDVLPEGLTYKEGTEGVSISGSTVTWAGNINAGETAVVSYTATVTSDIPGTKIESKQSSVNGVALGNITHTVAGFTKEHLTKVGSTAVAFATGGATFENGIEFAKAAYADSIGTYIFDEYSTVDQALSDLIDEDNYTCKTSTEISKMLVPNLYGGRLSVQGGSDPKDNFDKDRTRLISEAELSVGDIILADYSGGNIAYIYAGNKTLVSFKSGNCEIKEIGDNIYANPDNILISLFAYDRFAVLRPSMADLEVGGLTVTDISVTMNDGAKTEYNVGESFDKSSITVVATKSDGTTEDVTNFTVSPAKFTYPGDEITVNVAYRGVVKPITVKVVGEEPLSVEEALADGAKTGAKVQGIFAGVARDGRDGVCEFLLKDKNSNQVISVRSSKITKPGTTNDTTIFGKDYTDSYGYTKGDELVLEGTLKKDTLTNSNYNTNKLILSVTYTNPDDQKNTIVKSAAEGSTLSWNMEKMAEATVISSWADMQAAFVADTTEHYKFFKFTGETFISKTDRSGNASTAQNILHKNSLASKAEDRTTSTHIQKRALTIRNDVTNENLGTGWENLLCDSTTDIGTVKGQSFNKDFYAIYVGGGTYYYNMVILDESWILTSDDEPEEPEDPELPEVPEEATVTGIEVTTKPTKLVYTVGEALDTTGMVVTATKSDATTEVLSSSSYTVTPQTFTEAAASTTVTVSYETLTATFTVTVNAATQPEEPETPDEPEEIDALHVSEALTGGVKTGVKVQGIFAGVAKDGRNNVFEFLLKDKNSNQVISVRKSDTNGSTTEATAKIFGKTFSENFGYTIGDEIVLEGNIAKEWFTSTHYNKNKLLLQITTGTDEDHAATITKKAAAGTRIAWDMQAMANDAEVITSMDDMKTYFVDDNTSHYKLFKFTKGMFISKKGSSSVSDTTNILHKVNPVAAATDRATDTYPTTTSRYVAVRNDVMNQNLGKNWENLLCDSQTNINEWQGAEINKDFYAMYVGGNTYYYQLVILDESWIIDEVIETKVVSADNTSVTLQIGEVGDYDIVIADFEGNSLNNVEIIEKTVTDLGEVTIPRVKTFALNKDDKVMLFKDFKTLVPIGLPFIFE